MPDLKIVKQGIEPMEKICPLTFHPTPGAEPNGKYMSGLSGRCIGPQCAWFRGDVVTGLCAVPDIAGWLGNAYHAEYPAKG